MNLTAQSSSVSGAVRVPTSKSYLQRALALSLLTKGKSVILNPNYCDDVLSAINVIADLGAEVKATTERIVIKSTGVVTPESDEINCGESGLCARMFSPIIGLAGRDVILKTEGSLSSRPLGMVQDALLYLGAECTTNEGFSPMTIKGPLEPSEISVDGSVSSQLLTGLLIALTKVEGVSVIKVDNLKSKPYVDMTLEAISVFGGTVENDNYEKFTIKGEQFFSAKKYKAEGDWSSAAFLLVAGAVSGEVELDGLKLDSSQADRAIMKVLEMVGAEIWEDGESVLITKKDLNPFSFDATDCPDLFPPLVALAANCSGESRIEGVSRLKHKESDRATVLLEEFGNIGVEITIENNTMVIKGGNIKGGEMSSHNDHRIAMAAAVTSLNAEEAIVIKDVECVNKSYPEFFADFKELGGKVS